LRVQHDGHFWLAKSRDEWWDECRVSPKQVDRGLDILAELGIIERKLYKFDGSPTIHLRLIEDALLRAWNEAILPKGENGYSPKGKMDIDLSVKSLTETTTETTSDVAIDGVPSIAPQAEARNPKSETIPFVDEPTPEPDPVPVLVNPKPKREPKPRAPSEWQTQRHTLGTVFAAETGLAHDGLNYATLEKRWWSPLKAILGAAGGDMEKAKSLILLAIQQMRRNQLTISSPQSVEQVAIALSATRAPAPRGDGNAGTYHEQEQTWRAW
jgi:hypothetical protein